MVRLRSSKFKKRHTGWLFEPDYGDYEHECSNPQLDLPNAKSNVCAILEANMQLIQHRFRATVIKYRGRDAARSLKFKTLDELKDLVWRARMKPFCGYSDEVIGMTDGLTIDLDSRKKYIPIALRQVLLHEALHHFARVRNRCLGSCLDHLCMQSLGEEVQPDATTKMAKKRYPLAARCEQVQYDRCLSVG